MKACVFLASILLSTAALANTPKEALDSAIVDSLITSFQTPITPGELNLFPKSFTCGEVEFNYPEILNDTFASIRLNDTSEAALFDLTNGDQVLGVMVLKSDLEALGSGSVNEIQAKLYKGFWYADGSHYAAQDSTCSVTK